MIRKLGNRFVQVKIRFNDLLVIYGFNMLMFIFAAAIIFQRAFLHAAIAAFILPLVP